MEEPVLRTPEEWSELYDEVIRDPNGWRGPSGRPWTDPITREEYLDRRQCCTIEPRRAFGAETADRLRAYWTEPNAQQIDLSRAAAAFGRGMEQLREGLTLFGQELARVWPSIRLAYAQLAAHALNHMDGWGPDVPGWEAWTPEEEERGCCYLCCAPCAALHTLHESGQLSATVKPYIEASGGDWSWWDPAGVGEVRPQWLENGWRLTHDPKHVAEAHPSGVERGHTPLPEEES